MSKKRALIPFAIFLGIFASLHIFYPQLTNSAKDNFPIFAVFIAIIAAFFTFPKKTSLQKRVDIFVEGTAHPVIIHMCYIFMLSTVFTHVLEKIGAITAIVNIGLRFMPAAYALPGIFVITSIFSLAIGSSMGGIIAFMPIALQIAQMIGIPLPLLTATVICGSILGDNLSIVSDTTIAAVKMTKCSMLKKLKLNTIIAAPAFFGSFFILVYKNSFYETMTNAIPHYNISTHDLLALIPYIIIFGVTLLGMDILVALVLATFAATSIGLFMGDFLFSDAITFVFDGFYQSKGMVHIFILVMFLAGLSKIISHNGGLEYILEQAEKRSSHALHARIAIFFLVFLINCAIVINTISILITGSIAAKLGEKYKVDKAEVATILDIGSCISQGAMPYTPQVLLATSIAGISTFSILPHLFYLQLLLISLIGYFLYQKNTE